MSSENGGTPLLHGFCSHPFTQKGLTTNTHFQGPPVFGSTLNPEAYYNRALALQLSEKWEESLKVCKKGLERQADNKALLPLGEKNMIWACPKNRKGFFLDCLKLRPFQESAIFFGNAPCRNIFVCVFKGWGAQIHAPPPSG